MKIGQVVSVAMVGVMAVGISVASASQFAPATTTQRAQQAEMRELLQAQSAELRQLMETHQKQVDDLLRRQMRELSFSGAMQENTSVPSSVAKEPYDSTGDAEAAQKALESFYVP